MFGKYYPTTITELLSYIKEQDIYYYYFGDFELNHWYNSPFRLEKNPSFTISYYNNKLVWRDFGLDTRPYDCIDFIIRKYNLSYIEAIHKIYEDLVLDNSNIIKKRNIIPNTNSNIDIKPAVKLWKPKDWEVSYWKQGDISYEELLFYNIYGGEVWNKNSKILKSIPNHPVFVYLFNKLDKIWKAYNPYNLHYQLKFFGNNVKDHIQNYNNLGITNSKILFITKSYKDCIVINKLRYDSIAPHTENLFLSPWEIDFLKTKYDYIYVFYDNDSTGISKCIEFSNLYKVNYINIPHNLYYKDDENNNKIIKDPWDYVINYSYNELNDIIIEKFIRDKINK